MNKIRIITDSTCDIPQSRGEELGIEILPLTVSFGQEDYRDGIDIDSDTFYDMLGNAKDLPVTSQVNPAAFLQQYEEAQAAGEDILVVTLASKLSGTYQSACIAKEQMQGVNIAVVDSGSATIGLSSLIYKALEMRADGKSLDEITGKLEEIKDRIVIYACINTLTYLHKGGRLSTASTVLGGLLSIKPVIQVKNGELAVLHKAKGAKAAVKWISEKIAADGFDSTLPVGFVYSTTPERVDEFKDELKGKVDMPTDTMLQSLGAVLGTHIGPGCVGISLYTK